MKILLYTDNHFSQHSSIYRTRGSKYSGRLENQIRSINWLEELAVEKGCGKIICLGDFFDRSELNSEELTALKDIKWADNIEHIFIVGNHEMGSNDLQYSSSHVFESMGFKSVKFVDYEKIDDTGIIYLPYLLKSRRATLKDYVDELTYNNKASKYIVLSHNDISGIRYGQYVSKDGFDINDIYDNCDLFINGHLHNQTQINDKTLNLGNLTGQNFSEDATKYSHCVGILDTDTLSLDLVNNPYALEFYKIEAYTKDDIDRDLDKCKNNSIITLKTNSNLADYAKEAINSNWNIIQSKVLIAPEIKDVEDQTSIEQLLSVDHIQQFKDYCIANIDNSKELIDELSNLR